jgi:hypothetical protein
MKNYKKGDRPHFNAIERSVAGKGDRSGKMGPGPNISYVSIISYMNL